MEISGTRPLIVLDDNVLSMFGEDDKRELRALNKVMMAHKASVEEKHGKKFLRRLELVIDFEENLPELHYDETGLDLSLEQVSLAICNYGEYFGHTKKERGGEKSPIDKCAKVRTL